MNKALLLVCDQLADEPLPELNGRTTLEVAKTPHLDALAAGGRLGMASFVPSSLPATAEVAMFSILGYDPKEFYTGIAPLEAVALGMSQNDQEVAFRCDLVTVADGRMVDDTAGDISADEAAILLTELKKKMDSKRFRFQSLKGYRNLLMVHDGQNAETLDELETTPPRAILGQKTDTWIPKGELAKLLESWRVVLENHEVNRVRIDLKENPANQLWLWGQGKRPKLPTFKSRAGVDAALLTDARFMQGLGQVLGFHKASDIAGLSKQALGVAYHGFEGPDDLKVKIKHIEQFDKLIVGPALDAVKKSKEPTLIAVASTVVHSTAKKSNTHAQAPFALYGEGIEAGHAAGFTEKNCAQSGLVLESGQAFVDSVLRK